MASRARIEVVVRAHGLGQCGLHQEPAGAKGRTQIDPGAEHAGDHGLLGFLETQIEDFFAATAGGLGEGAGQRGFAGAAGAGNEDAGRRVDIPRSSMASRPASPVETFGPSG